MARRLPADPSEAIGIAVVKYNYQAQQPDELSLVKGSRILILEKSNDGWWRGQSSNISGWFPSNYTQEEGEVDDTLHTYAMAENVLDIVVALYSFSSSNEQELSFEKGDRLEILDRPASDPEWYKARNSQGQVGLVPRNYLQELSDYMDRPFQERNKPGGMESSMERSQASMVDKPHLVDKPWYYGSITRYVCDNLLNQHGHDGDFLIRDSETNEQLHPLSKGPCPTP
ncbi:cytoplasmic protein NCK1 isoform X1 [Anoplophora glabripennis]|uniref:cytoplasmic protein NCK1 isoform X1 n=1 Tax=Anoplophora glabripennis TaxID=217634 RepID=UPI0008736110|nr:cytoplasmic protein NCK1 isoform X1 [Anoplophora glabripennis]